MNPTDPTSQIFDQFSSLFGEFFGKLGCGVSLAVTDEEAANGVTREVAFTHMATCPSCAGRGGATPEDVRVPCAACQGRGNVKHVQGFFTIQTACATCKGAGGTIKNACAACAGAGATRVPATMMVAVPAGIEHGTHLKLEHAGEPVFVQVLVGGRPSPAELAFQNVALEPAIPQARVVPRPTDRSNVRFYAILALVLAIIVAFTLLRH